ncbi:MAG: DPP IV N-terminal domain-containing protein [Gemmatimonadales bacterium]
MRTKTLILLALAFLLLPLSARAQEKTRFRSVTEALQASGILSGRSGPRNVNWIDGGRRYSFIARGDSGEEIRGADPATGKDTLLFRAAGLTFPGTDEAFTYQSFQWSKDSEHLIFQTHFKRIYRRSGTSDFYVYSLARKTLQLAAEGAQTGELSPDGAMLGYERGGDLYVYNLAREQETRLTNDATWLKHNGRFDWVYEEEFGMAQAWNWSPDSRHIAFWQVDESPEPVFNLTDYSGWHTSLDSIRVPQVGDSNAHVRIGVLEVGTGRKQWLDTGEAPDTYIPRIYWTSSPDTLAVMTLNRAQNTMKLFFFNVWNGGRRLVLQQMSDSWIDVFDFYAGIQDMMSFPESTREFFWISDQDGWQHVYRYDYSGRLLNQVTRGPWSVTRIEGINPKSKTIYYSSTEVSPLQRQLYSIRYDGSRKTRLTRTRGTHRIDMSPNTMYYIDRWSATDQPQQVEMWATGKRMLQKIEDNAATSRWLETHAYSPTELFSFTTSDSVRIDGSLVKPPDFDSTRAYPVIFSIYGGPGSQQVYDQFSGSGITQWLAQKGYIVVGLNNRGSNNYGSAFMKVVHGRLGRWETNDFAEAARYLTGHPWADATRVAIMGTSYGGYSVLYAMALHPDVFSVGIANSAVSDWRYYDTIYTERYLGLLPDNAAGYDSSSVLTHVKNIKGHLLIIHSMMDDNVHPQNTMAMLTALTNAGVDADLRIYPPGRHGAAYNGQSFRLIQQVTEDYLDRWLMKR